MRNFIRRLYEWHYARKVIYNKYSRLFGVFSLAVLLFWVFTFKNVILDASNIPTGSMIPSLKVGDFLFVNKMRYTFHIPFLGLKFPMLRMDVPKRGDIVTFHAPEEAGFVGKVLVKRVIGIPGDEVQVINNRIIVNNLEYPLEPVENSDILNDLVDGSHDYYDLWKEKVLDPTSKKVLLEYNVITSKHIFDTRYRNPERIFYVPSNKYMMIGDNRDNSDDSRRWGFVDVDKIFGKVFMAYFSVNWGRSYQEEYHTKTFLNPIALIFDWVTGRMPDAFVRWSRIGKRIY